ncbi:Septal ring factor EnvC, activator of murein hydrolases AmiA and AmiB [Ectothiorhodospira magna]|uniref:Septal ring factor EnvC, activator of murein hydrolases AmiA and AmiB n=1 Tax=Ectothiorhodospira magna TaxID=867345 RepID=A0A1H9AI77_9GAMM|nr:peptidoglycan DD-metalloendopeptidase family protein [Ectothiorhodospira magna]SEP76369.1 Septal ring factor EnvC, activator of murein hydrolases AmiA and AmiB [Ectothiorhodospira magna]
MTSRLWGLALSLLIPLLLLPTGLMAGPEREEAVRRLEQVQQQIRTVRERLEAARGEQGRLERQLRETEQAMAQTARELAETEAALTATAARLRTLERQQRDETTRLEAHRNALAEQMRAAHRMGQQDRLKLLLNQEDPARISRLLIYHDYYQQARQARIEATVQALADLTQTRRQLDLTRLHQTEQRRILLAQQQRLEQQRTTRTGVLDKLRQEIAGADTSLARLRADEDTLEALLKTLDEILSDIPDHALTDHAFADRQGQLPFPVRGPLLHRFGSPRDSGTGRRWQGVVIGAREGEPVRAIYPGRIAFADWMRGFGLLLIIDHGDGYMTLYGHNQTLYTSPGAWVQAGDLIARVGDTGGIDRTGLYFEIRHEGTPLNPGQWCDSKLPVVGSR